MCPIKKHVTSENLVKTYHRFICTKGVITNCINTLAVVVKL